MLNLRTIDLFAGAGGLSLGFHQAGKRSDDFSFEPVYAVEQDAAAALTYKTNFGIAVSTRDIRELDPSRYPDAEVIIGGPPCQGFSPLGRDRDPLSRSQLNGLWEHFLEAVAHVRPQAFVIENVPQFQKSAQFNELLHRLSHDERFGGYRVAHGVLNAADYGVPQVRRRGILVAILGESPVWPPAPTHGDGKPEPHRTVRNAFGGLPAEPTTDEPTMLPNGCQDLHIRRNPRQLSLDRYRQIPPGGNRFDLPPHLMPACWRNKPSGTTDVMGRLWWDRPSLTIRTEFFKPEKGRYLHPEEDRPITHREAARLQSFDDSFIFEGSKIQIARQIGNAVPPGLAEAIASSLGAVLTGVAVAV